MPSRNFTLKVARNVLRMLHGESLPYGKFYSGFASDMLQEGIVITYSRGTRTYCQIPNPERVRVFLAQACDIHIPLEEWIALKEREEAPSRAEQVNAFGNSKNQKVRSFPGFLLNCASPVEATLSGNPITLMPRQGLSYFIDDFQHFRLPKEVVVVGVENGENFRQPEAQQYLFADRPFVFVSRYPQSADLRTWLQQIPNHYLHFGDFDLAGISIYLSEFYAYLGERAEFFIPADIEERLRDYGNRRLYEKQYPRYQFRELPDKRLLPLIDLIHRYQAGYEQEGYIPTVCPR